MSKRKSITQPLTVKNADDMVFEDDDEIESAEIETESAADSAESMASRVSGRTKKTKAIFDPSEYNGPVHKRKKDAQEVEKSVKTEKSTPTKIPKPDNMKPPSPTKQAAITTAFKMSTKPKEDKVEEKGIIVKSKVVGDLKKRLSLDVKKRPSLDNKKRMLVVSKKPPAPQVQKITAIATVPSVKEPSKRIQARKHVKEPAVDGSRKQRPSSTSTGFSTSDDNASTVAVRDSDIPDVRKWTHGQVSQYFNTTLGFTKHDSAVFNDEEIDGETLLIMKRSDIVNTKFQTLKLGTALKMWSQIIKFQTGSNDLTQAWK